MLKLTVLGIPYRPHVLQQLPLIVGVKQDLACFELG